MKFGGGSRNKGKSKASKHSVICFCGLPAKISQAWTDKNPGRRFYGCERYKRPGECKFFQWFDEEEPVEWQKEALIKAKNEIDEKNKTIAELMETISELRSALVKKEEAEEDIINNFLKL